MMMPGGDGQWRFLDYSIDFRIVSLRHAIHRLNCSRPGAIQSAARKSEVAWSCVAGDGCCIIGLGAIRQRGVARSGAAFALTMPYYHATTRDRVQAIQRDGLGGSSDLVRNFAFSQDGVCLASDPMMAVGFLLERAVEGEWAHLSPKEALSLFVVFVIDDSRVDSARLRTDPNIMLDGFWLYGGVIDVTAMPVISAEDVAQACSARLPRPE
jgi:hypothetical protein